MCRAAAEAVVQQYISSNTNVAFGNGELVRMRQEGTGGGPGKTKEDPYSSVQNSQVQTYTAGNSQKQSHAGALFLHSLTSEKGACEQHLAHKPCWQHTTPALVAPCPDKSLS